MNTQSILRLFGGMLVVLSIASPGALAEDALKPPVIKYYAQADPINFYGSVQVREPEEKAGDDIVEASAITSYRVFDEPKLIPKDIAPLIAAKLFVNDVAAEKQIMDGPIMGSFGAFILFDSARKPVAIVTQRLSVYFTASLRTVSGDDTFQIDGKTGVFSFCAEMDGLVGVSLGPKPIIRSPYLKWLGKPAEGPLPPIGSR